MNRVFIRHEKHDLNVHTVLEHILSDKMYKFICLSPQLQESSCQLQGLMDREEDGSTPRIDALIPMSMNVEDPIRSNVIIRLCNGDNFEHIHY